MVEEDTNNAGNIEEGVTAPSGSEGQEAAGPAPMPEGGGTSEPSEGSEAGLDAKMPELTPNLNVDSGAVSEPTGPFADAQGKVVSGGASPAGASGVPNSGFGGLLARARAAIFNRKQKKLEKIVEMALRQKAQGKLITNDDVEKLLRVSDKTAERYLAELVKQGKLRKTGTTSQTKYEI